MSTTMYDCCWCGTIVPMHHVCDEHARIQGRDRAAQAREWTHVALWMISIGQPPVITIRAAYAESLAAMRDYIRVGIGGKR